MPSQEDHDSQDRNGEEGEGEQNGRVDDDVQRESRAQMRELRAGLERDNRNYDNVSAKTVLEKLRKQNEIYESTAKNTESSVIDAENLIFISDTFQKVSKKGKSEANLFDMNDFLDPLRAKLGFHLPPIAEENEIHPGGVRKNGELGDWEKIGWMATKRMRTVMGLESMNGMMAIEHKKRVVKQRAKQAPLAAEVRPVEMQQEDMEAYKNETTENVRSIYKRLLRYEEYEAPNDYIGVNFYEWIINPASFSESVENLFYTSFLVREGKLAIDFDDEGVPRIYDAVSEDDAAPVVNADSKIQEVLEFDKETWLKAIELFDIKKPIINARGASDT